MVGDARAATGELIRVPGYAIFKPGIDEQRELLADYLPYCRTVSIPARAPGTPHCRGAFGLPFLQLASVGNVEVHVTGDQDLPGIEGKLASPVVTLEAFLSALPPA